MTAMDLLDRRVASLRRSRPDLADALSLQEAMIRAVLASPRPPQTRSFPLPKEHVAARLQQGVPLLHDQPVWLDIHFAADLFSRLANALGDSGERFGQAVDLLVDAATSGLLDPEQLFAEAFVNHPDHLMELAIASGVDGDLLSMLATRAVAPVLQAYADRLLPIVERVDAAAANGSAWTQGYCPICGSWPLLAELRGSESVRWLRCAICGSRWRQPRLQCPYCANDDPQSLGPVTVQDEHRFHLAVCEACKGYLKVGRAFDPSPAALLPLDDAVSLRLDIAAGERGYQRPSGGGFRIELALTEVEWMEELA